MPPPGARRRVFAALRHRNFRLFFIGQFISLVGTWMQRIAQAWLVLNITHSPFLLGLVGALQWLPVLFLSLVGGVLADRVSKRSVLVVTQSAQMGQAFILGVLVLTGTIQYWHVVVLACALGFTSAFDIPTRQAFVFEMVEGEDTMNAVAMNSTIFNGARLFGPAVAGVAIGTLGMGWAFIANGVSFVAVIIALLMMNVRPVEPITSGGLLEHLQEGIAYVRRTPAALQVVVLVALMSVFAMNFNILVPVLAKDVLHEEAAGFGFLTSAQGIGALIGALWVASISHLGPRPSLLLGGAAVLSVSSFLLADARHFAVAAALLAIAGGSMVTFTAMANTSLQLTAPDHLRGRVMSMYAIVMGGMTPAGALVAGTLAQFWGAPGAFAVGGLVGIVSVFMVWRWRAATRLTPEPIAGAAQNDRGRPDRGTTAGDGGFGPAPADEE
ncbi:MAG TPA: MFS transporter [Gaiellales bacterium]|nr:MFS transporter [Gaiellales bacterium]